MLHARLPQLCQGASKEGVIVTKLMFDSQPHFIKDQYLSIFPVFMEYFSVIAVGKAPNALSVNLCIAPIFVLKTLHEYFSKQLQNLSDTLQSFIITCVRLGQLILKL